MIGRWAKWNAFRVQCVSMPKFAKWSKRGWIIRGQPVDGYSWSSFASVWTLIGSANKSCSCLFETTSHQVCFFTSVAQRLNALCRSVAAGWEGVQITSFAKTSKKPNFHTLADNHELVDVAVFAYCVISSSDNTMLSEALLPLIRVRSLTIRIRHANSLHKLVIFL